MKDIILHDITVFEALWNDRLYGWAESIQEARQLIEEHYAFGEPESVEDYCVGTKWAKNENDTGWRIIDRQVEAALVCGVVEGSIELDETVHLIWQCPFCHRYSSEDFHQEDTSPILNCCTCGGGVRKYILVSFRL